MRDDGEGPTLGGVLLGWGISSGFTCARDIHRHCRHMVSYWHLGQVLVSKMSAAGLGDLQRLYLRARHAQAHADAW